MNDTTKSLLQTITLPDGSTKQVFKRGSIVFTYGGGIGDFIIHIAQGFRGFSHCGIALGDGKMIAAWGNVGKVIYQDDLQQLQTEAIYPLKDPVLVEQMITIAKGCLGKPYDYLGLLAVVGVPIGIGGPPKAFFCSSLVAYSMGLHGNDRKYKPQDLWDLFH